tara:strand:+ start:23 stop:1021 length:999 start_codon:yes stop_codon:yes gene_type:complete
MNELLKSVWNNPQISSFRSYYGQGAMLTTGFTPTGMTDIGVRNVLPLGALERQALSIDPIPWREPVVGTPVSASKGILWEGYNSRVVRGDGAFPTVPLGQHAKGMGAALGIAGSVAGLGFTGYNIISGYQEGGIWGAKDAAVWEIATASAAARFAYGSLGTSGPSNQGRIARLANIGQKKAGTVIKFGGGAGFLAGATRSAGAAMGASLGQAVLGTPGAFIGAYVGAAPMRFAASHPLIAGGMVAGAAVAAVGYGTYSMISTGLQAGRQHRQRQRGIDTSGSMAAFMTQGASTMRARAVQAIHKSHLNARSALGQEAGFMHMPSKNYHSNYR